MTSKKVEYAGALNFIIEHLTFWIELCADGQRPEGRTFADELVSRLHEDHYANAAWYEREEKEIRQLCTLAGF